MNIHVVEWSGGTVNVGRMTAQQMIQIQDEFEAASRSRLIDDMDAAGLDPSERMERLRADREASGNIVVLIRAAFDIRWAIRILEVSMGERHPFIDELGPEQVTRAALWSLGSNYDQMVEEDAAENSEGN
tara:strand:+ start:2852 stop:3241 length:390 start_codon:yes stop_codon:yes gene_type:complete